MPKNTPDSHAAEQAQEKLREAWSRMRGKINAANASGKYLPEDQLLAELDRILGYTELVAVNEKLQRAVASWNTRMDELLAQRDELLEALREIAKGEGAFSLDHKQHAINTIENMKSLAESALRRVKEGK